MAYTSSIDELNNLQTEQDKQKIRAYFEEMDLEPEEIEKRIGVANDLDNLYLILFLLMTASVAAGENVIDQNAYWNDYLTRGYNDVLTENGYNTDDPMVSNRIDETVAEVLNTTYEHIAQSYYLSHDRALMIASNDTNAFANYEYHIRKIKEGYTRKRWVTKVDKKTRHDHVWADGQEVDIQMPFIVGGYEMLFPLDQSLGADAKEVINCRCSCAYFGKSDEHLSENEESHKGVENRKFEVRTGIVNSSEYGRNISLIEPNRESADIIKQQTRTILKHRNGSEYEDLTWINSTNNKFMSRTDYNVPFRVEPSEEMLKMLESAPPKSIISIHNHPESSVPSPRDVYNAQFYKYGIIACHDGTLIKYTVNNLNSALYYSAIAKIDGVTYTDDAIKQFISDALKAGVKIEVFK